MFLRSLSLLLLWLSSTVELAPARVLRVCGDPDNLPFSNQEKQGFENRIAQLLADELQARLEYVWWSQHKPFVKSTLNEDRCDLVMGVPDQMDSVLATQPYYRSSYVFVTVRSRKLHVQSLNDSRFPDWRVGLHLVGENYAPPAHALARRGVAANLAGFSLTEPAKIFEALIRGDIDVAVVWGPFAGYFAQRSTTPLEVTTVTPQSDGMVPFTYAISAGVRKGNAPLMTELNVALERRAAAIRKVLDEYGVPQ